MPLHALASASGARHLRRALPALVLLLALGTTTVAHAAVAARAVSAFADSTRPVTFLREIVVTGARYPRAYYQSPEALSFVNRTQLRESVPTVIGDVLGTLPGVDNSKDSPWEQRPIVRGLSGQRVLVLMDGAPMNSARGNGPHPSLVDPSQIERVEVVRGPSSVSYGSDAIGGVINIITREAPAATVGRSFTGSATQLGSSAESQYGGSFDATTRVERLGLFTSAGWRHADDFRSPTGTVANSGFRDWNGLANVRYDFSERLVLKGGYQVYRGTGIGIPGLSSPTATYPDGMQSVFHFTYYNRDLAHLALDHQYEHTWIASSHIKAYRQQERRNFFSTERVTPAFYGPNGSIYRTTNQDRYLDLDTWGAQIQMSSVRTARYFFTMGLDAARDRTGGPNVRFRNYVYPTARGDSAGAVATLVSASLPKGDFDNVALYWQNQMFLSPLWTVSGGLRWTQYRYRSEAGLSIPASGPSPAFYFPALKVDNGSASGSLGVVYEPVPDLHLSANIANGHRQPTAQELFFKGAASVGFVIGEPALKPEESVSYDTGLRWERGGLAVSGNLFYTTFSNMIDALAVPIVPEAKGQPTYQYKNISKARMWGGEAEGQWRFLPQWRARATVTGAVGDIVGRDAILKLYGVAVDNAPLPSVPPFRGNFALRWNDREGRGWVEASSRYSWRTNRLPLPVAGVSQIGAFKSEWMAFDVMSGCRFGNGHRIALGVRNLANMRYRQAFGSLDEPGRSLVGSLTTSF